MRVHEVRLLADVGRQIPMTLKTKTSQACQTCHACCLTWPGYYLNTKGQITRLRWYKEMDAKGTIQYLAKAPNFLKKTACEMLDERGKCKLYGKRRPEPCTQYLCNQALESNLAQGSGL